MLNPNTCPKGTRVGFKYLSLMINVPQYLQYLLQKAKDVGAVVIQDVLPTSLGFEAALTKAIEIVNEKSKVVQRRDITAFVNATGLGASTLVPDATMFPIRGQTITVSGEADQITTINFEPDLQKPSESVITYILPRPHSNTTVIGGTKQVGDWNPEPDQETIRELLARAKPFATELLNDKGEFTVLSCQVGFRPGRQNGPRVELEKYGDFTVCHAYGHGGAGMDVSVSRVFLSLVMIGYQNSVGCANQVVQLLNSVST